MALRILQRCKTFIKVLTGSTLVYPVQTTCLIERHGSDYGGWVICPTLITKDSVIYSFGIGEDLSFDVSVISKYGLTVHAFDPTPRSIAWVKSQSLPTELKVHDFGVAEFDGTIKFNPPSNPNHVSYSVLDRSGNENDTVNAPVHRLETIMGMLGHDHIDILKMDIEGAEYAVIEDLIRSGIPVTQLLIEFHHRFPQVGTQKTKDVIEALNKSGYSIFAVSSSGEEFSFVYAP